MEPYHIEKDISVVCVSAASFPDGVEAAHKKLHSLLSSIDKRTCYGISYSDGKGGIIYKAAAQQLEENEASTYGLETFVIRKGEYMSELLLNFCEDMALVGKTFQKLLALPALDPKGYCLELYLSDKDMRCMVPLKK
jgi:predicted transcriptional regulator YdeE